MIFGVVFTATRLNLSRFDNELRFRGQAHADLTEVLTDPRVKAGLRCGPLTGPNHKIVPDARWIAGLGDGQVLRARRELPRRPRRAAPGQGRGDRGHQPLRDLQARLDRTPTTTRASSSRRRASSASRRRGSTPRMSVAEPVTQVDERVEPTPPRRAGLGWLLALAGLFVAAFVLRLVGLKTGPAVRLQRGREQPLRAAGDRHVRAQPEPGLLHQPAGVHVRHPRAVRGPLGDRPGERSAARSRPIRPRRSRSRAAPPRSSARSPSR